MGLDMYLYAEKYVSGTDFFNESDPTTYLQLESAVGAQGFKPEHDSPSATVSIKVAQWRKANQIHQWFVDNTQEGEDNCARYYVTREKITELRDLCQQVLADHSKAEELLPVSEGFFFGHYDYDDWYFGQLKETNTNLTRVLSNVPEKWDFYYQSSW